MKSSHTCKNIVTNMSIYSLIFRFNWCLSCPLGSLFVNWKTETPFSAFLTQSISFRRNKRMKKILSLQLTTKNSTGSNSGKLQPIQQKLKKLQNLKKPTKHNTPNKPSFLKDLHNVKIYSMWYILLGKMHFWTH